MKYRKTASVVANIGGNQMDSYTINMAMRFIQACETAKQIIFLSEQCKKELADASAEIQRRLDSALEKCAVIAK